MADHDQVRALLTRAAEVIAVEPPQLAALEQRERARRHRIAIGAPLTAIVTVVAIVLAVVAVRHHASQSSAPPVTRHPTSATRSTTPDALAGYRWRTLPKAPITPRNNAVSVWTGTQLLVWGGSSRDRTFADGAAYDPSSRTWTTLPPAPLAARVDPAYAWSGGRLFIWGGRVTGVRYFSDGATYDPSTRRWATLPPAPFHGPGAYRDVSAYAVDGKVVVLTTPYNVRTPKSSFGASEYDPARNAWSSLPRVPMVPGHAPDYATVVAAGSELFLWSLWTHSVRTADGMGATSTTGVDPYVLDLRTRAWSDGRMQFPRGKAPFAGLWTGNRVLVPTVGSSCFECGVPVTLGTPSGLALDPRSGAATRIAPAPVGVIGRSFWTGGLLLAVNVTVTTGGPLGVHHPGETASWDPRTGLWTRQRSAPAAQNSNIGSAAMVWTSSRLLMWGLLRTPEGGSTPTTGLEFAR